MHDKLATLCREAMDRKGFSGQNAYETRLETELTEIKKQDDAIYPVKLHEKGIKAAKNTHNLLVYFLLDICTDFDISRQSAYTDPEYPDIDVDFLPDVRTYLKDDWVPKRYGEQYVCNISNYNTFGLKSSLIDIARTLGEDRNEILNITTKLGMKDDEGDPLTWETAQILHQELAEYLKAHPRVAEITKGLVHADIDWEKFGYKNPPHRKRGMGMHASGLVISAVKVSDFVPMVVSSGNREKGLQASAWVEGLADTDLSSVGFIKFDFLSLEANAKIAECNKLIRARHGLDSICAFPGMSTWSDTSYLNDEKALEMANKGDLKGIFQFDSDGIRKLVRTGGVSSFDDLAAYTALYRPGPMDVGMHDEFINRKHGKKPWSLPPVGDTDFLESMRSTYSVLVYQEQVMRYLSNVGKIPIAQCQGVIKAISKKKVEKFKKYRDEFIKNCQITLGITEAEAIEKWAEVESFAGYGFNLSHSVAYTYISSRQLWQKAHYPIEFYAEDLAHLKTADERIRFYTDDARVHGIKVNRLDLNKSGENFSIVDKYGERDMPAGEGDEIYYGFSKIKGIGDEVAQRVVSLQPYSGFIDFLERFGTDAKVVQALIALRVFKEADPIILYKFYETYKKKKKKEEDRGRRNVKSVTKYKDQLKELCPDMDWLTFDEVDFSKARPYVDVGKWKEMTALKKKYDRCVATYASKTQEAEESNEVLTLESFKHEEVEIDPETEMLLKDNVECEIAYYGFEWEHPLSKCEDKRNLTWEQLHMDLVTSPQVLPVEVLIKSVETATTKSGKPMLKMRCEDAMRQTMLVTAWSEEIERFGEDLKAGACVRLRVKCEKAKDRDSYWYNLESFGWQDRGRTPKSRENDFRVYVMKEAK